MDKSKYRWRIKWGKNRRKHTDTGWFKCVKEKSRKWILRKIFRLRPKDKKKGLNLRFSLIQELTKIKV